MQIATKSARGTLPQQVNIAITAGETVALAMTIAINTGTAANPILTPINLNGYSLKMQINTPVPIDLNTTNGGIVITNAPAGQAQIKMPSSMTAPLPVGPYPYDLWMVSGDGIETPLWPGVFNVMQNITPVP